MFVVFSTSAVPVGLRGELTRWLLEVAPGTFVGNLSSRVRDALWDLCVQEAGNGSVLLVHAARNEQRLAFRTHGTNWMPVDQEGLTLILRPESPIHGKERTKASPTSGPHDSLMAANSSKNSDPSSWSIAARRRRYRTPIEQRDARKQASESARLTRPEGEVDPPF